MLLNQATSLPQSPNRRPWLLLLIILVILMGLGLTSCMTDAKVARLAHERGICPTVKDSTSSREREEITHRDSSFDVPAKEGPAVSSMAVSSDDSTHKCPWRDLVEDLEKHPRTQTGSGITTTLSAKKENGKEKITASCRENEYRLRLDNAITERNIYKEKFEEVVKHEKCLEPHKTRYTYWAEVGFPLLLLLVLAYITYRVRKGARDWLRRVTDR